MVRENKTSIQGQAQIKSGGLDSGDIPVSGLSFSQGPVTSLDFQQVLLRILYFILQRPIANWPKGGNEVYFLKWLGRILKKLI